MESTLYEKFEHKCTFSSSDFSIHEKSTWYGIEPDQKKDVVSFKVDVNGKEWKILWPNREGELLAISSVYEVIDKYEKPEGLTLSYPATASCRTVVFFSTDDSGVALFAPPDKSGRVCEFTLTGSSNDRALLVVKGYPENWFVFPFGAFAELEIEINKIKRITPRQYLSFKHSKAHWQVQVGLIGTDGKTYVPETKGFEVLSEISLLMKTRLGKGNILHVFGYAEGHDKGYPNYVPSAILGGSKRLKTAIEKVHGNDQKIVFYLNGRIAQRDRVINTPLYDSVVKDAEERDIVEQYHGRDFFVMNPLSIKWRQEILQSAKALKSLGADGVQLDQLGGRSAAVPVGKVWGKGYVDLIENLHSEGMSVWIQGLSDIYPADWFELTYRDVSILEDGTIRGGTPFGKPDKRLFELSVPGQVLLVPLSKIDSFPTAGKNIVIDLDIKRGELFLYNELYMEQLDKIISSVANKS